MPKATVQPNEIRSTGPAWERFPGDVPGIAYVTKDGAFLCVTCANGGNGSLAALGDDTDPQWQILGAQTSDGSDWYTCAHCDRQIPAGGRHAK